MLFPRFSLKLILLLNVGFAAVFLVTKFAVEGQEWALAFVLSVLTALLLVGTFGLFFLAAFSFSFAYRSRRPPPTESPFATDKLPPQVIPPRDIDL
jgi:hypothetical protein